VPFILFTDSFSLRGGCKVHPPPPSTLHLNFYPYLPHPFFRDARGILNPVLQHWWIRFTRKLFPYVSPRASFSYFYEIHTSSNSAVEPRTTTTVRSGSIKLFTKIPHHAPSHGTRYFSYLNRSLVVSRSKYFFPKKSLHGRMKVKNWNFPDDGSQLCSSWLHFSELKVQVSRIVQKLTFCDTCIYVLRRKQRSINRVQNAKKCLYSVEEGCFASKSFPILLARNAKRSTSATITWLRTHQTWIMSAGLVRLVEMQPGSSADIHNGGLCHWSIIMTSCGRIIRYMRRGITRRGMNRV